MFKPGMAWTLVDWQAAYRSGKLRPDALFTLLDAWDAGDPAWIALARPEQLAEQLAQLALRLERAAGDLSGLPLYGVPFAVKDNIDVQRWQTSAACPAFAYEAVNDAAVVARLREAGAVVVGKTNLDQFATGLVGTRSPYGAVPNSFNPDYVCGGSSSGSASVVARGLLPFSLGTDTAGSGRVPAGFNNIVGLKPTRGWLSTTGLVPACRTLDCISVFALTVADALAVAEIAAGFDSADPYSRRNPNDAPVAFGASLRLAVPDPLEFFGDEPSRLAFDQALAELKVLGATVERIGFGPFRELAEQLYQGSWLAERTVALESVLQNWPEAVDPVVRGIVEKGIDYSACDAYKAEYKRAELAREIGELLSHYDALVVPTSPTVRTLAEIASEPIVYNAQFGTYTNFVNLADLCALAVPASMRADGLPFGITLIAPAWRDRALAAFGKHWQTALRLPLGATGRPFSDGSASGQPAGCVRVAVVGAHLTGMPLNHQLTGRNAVRVEAASSAPVYRLYALSGTEPPKPGLVRCADGASINLELWDVPLARFGEFVAEIAPPLGIGNVELSDGQWVKGFICEPWALQDALDITEFGGWLAYLADRNNV